MSPTPRTWELASLDKMLKDKSDATWPDHRGGNCRHSFTGPCSTRSELSIARIGPRTRLSTIRFADGVQSYKLEHTATSVHRSVGAECKMESLVRQTRLAQTMAQVSVLENQRHLAIAKDHSSRAICFDDLAPKAYGAPLYEATRRATRQLSSAETSQRPR